MSERAILFLTKARKKRRRKMAPQLRRSIMIKVNPIGFKWTLNLTNKKNEKKSRNKRVNVGGGSHLTR